MEFQKAQTRLLPLEDFLKKAKFLPTQMKKRVI